ncbi:MAG: hypothetical protein MUO97_10145 [Dehalococcoidia bacterium]|nr:hypothetical protein [Dehalococcoidia bacterium]
MTKLRAWRCFSVVMAMALILGVGVMAVLSSHALADGGTWDIQTVDDIDVNSTSLALDGNGYPHISYATTGGPFSLHYARWTGTAWAKETVDESFVISTSMALDSNGYPHISYTTFAIGDNSLHYARWTGTAWAKETVDESDVISTSIALDSNDRPHISYATADLAIGSLHYARWTGTAWVKETVDPADASDTSIALDSHDLPHISYFVGTGGFLDGADGVGAVIIGDHSITGMLKYAHWTGAAWDIQTVDEETVTLDGLDGVHGIGLLRGGKWSSIALDSYDLPKISYGNLVPGSVDVRSLHYAHFIPPDTATVNTATGTGTATFSTSAGGIANLTAANSTPCGTLSGFSFPHGFFSFTITDILPGSTVTITITLPSGMRTSTQYWKCINGQWVNATSILGDNDGDNILTLTITDGSQFDADGQANSTIVDPGGPAVAVAPALPPAKPRVSPRTPASMSVQYMNINPQQAYANQSITITTNVANTGGEAGSLNVALKINGQVEQSRIVSVGPQGTQPVKFTVTKAQPGAYTVDIGGQKGSFTILGAGSSTTGTSSSDRMIGILIIIGALVLATVLVVWLLIRRPA